MWKRRRYQNKPYKKLIKVYFLAAVLVILILVFLSKNFNWFSIRQVEVDMPSLECVTTSELKNYPGFKKQTFFSLNIQKAINDLKRKYVCIKSVAITRYFPNKIKLKVIKREPFAILIDLKEKPASMSSLLQNIATPSAIDINDSYLIDSEGMVFSSNTKELLLPIIYSYNTNPSKGDKLKGKKLKDVLTILEKVQIFNIDTSTGWIFDDYFVINTLTSRLKIIFSLEKDIKSQLASLQLILQEAKINHGTIPIETGMDSKDLEFIDLRFDKPVIKLLPKK